MIIEISFDMLIQRSGTWEHTLSAFVTPEIQNSSSYILTYPLKCSRKEITNKISRLMRQLHTVQTLLIKL